MLILLIINHSLGSISISLLHRRDYTSPCTVRTITCYEAKSNGGTLRMVDNKRYKDRLLYPPTMGFGTFLMGAGYMHGECTATVHGEPFCTVAVHLPRGHLE